VFGLSCGCNGEHFVVNWADETYLSWSSCEVAAKCYTPSINNNSLPTVEYIRIEYSHLLHGVMMMLQGVVLPWYFSWKCW